jgi:hypothetical protein
MDEKAFELAWGKVVAKAWSDDLFKNRLLAEPETVLHENGIELRPGASVKIVEDTADMRHLVLPPRPSGELTDDELAGVSGGGAVVVCSYAYSPAETIVRVAGQIRTKGTT